MLTPTFKIYDPQKAQKLLLNKCIVSGTMEV